MASFDIHDDGHGRFIWTFKNAGIDIAASPSACPDDGTAIQAAALVKMSLLGNAAKPIIDHSKAGFSWRLVADGGRTIAVSVKPAATRAAAQQDAELFMKLAVNTEIPGQIRPPVSDELVGPPIDRTTTTRLRDSVRFLYEGSSRVQIGVAAGAIEPHRPCVIRGTVLGRQKVADDPTPLLDVTIRIVGHPELGSTRTREKGRFDLVANGGGLLSLEFAKPGFLPMRRTVFAGWEEFVGVPTVVLTSRAAAAVTDLGSTPSSSSIRAAVGLEHTDDDNGIRRRATLLFPGGAMARAQATTEAEASPPPKVGIVEFTTGPAGQAAMPALLPPTSGYTYAVDFSLEETAHAEFDQPLVHYVENFLNFDVGSPVPSGYFDTEHDCWLPSENGRVIKILGESKGLALIDISGKGTAATARAMEDLGISDAERQQLLQLYKPGQSLWRVRIPHFSAWDLNWPFGPPDDATAPGQPAPRDEDREATDEPPDQECHSIVRVQNQVLGERIGIPGTMFTLNYASDRAPGRKVGYTLDIPLSGATVPKSLQSIELEVIIAGQETTEQFKPAPNQVYSFHWNGLDVYGRQLQGKQPVKVRVGYTYTAVYQEPSEHEKSFAQYSGKATQNPARQELTLWQEWRGTLGAWDARGQGLGGWSVNLHHVFDTVGRALYFGDGERRNFDPGTGDARLSRFLAESNAAATVKRLYTPEGIAIDKDGTVYAADLSGNVVFRITPDGRSEIFVGRSSDDSPSIVDYEPGGPYALVIGADGSLFISEQRGHCVSRVTKDGTFARIAGKEEYSTIDGDYSGDGGPAHLAGLSAPTGLALDSNGTLFIADTGNRRIRRVGTNGIITTVAGTGEEGDVADGLSALKTPFNSPVDVAIASDGSLFIADAGISDNLVRRIGPDGLVTTVMGTRESVPDSDQLTSGIATQIRLNLSNGGVECGPDGAIYVAEYSESVGGRVWRVTKDGRACVFAGGGDDKVGSGDQAARSVKFEFAERMAMSPDGALYLSHNGLLATGSPPFICRIKGAFEGQGLDQIAIPDESAGAIHLFAASGRHLKTLNASDGSLRYEFKYDERGQLSAVNNSHYELLRIERNSTGNPTMLVARGSQHTCELNRDGYLSSVSLYGQERYELTYDSAGLLATFRRPTGFQAQYTYDDVGRLIRDEDSEGSKLQIERTANPGGFQIKVSKTLAGKVRETTYDVETHADGTRHQAVNRGQMAGTLQIPSDNARTIERPDGTKTDFSLTPDPLSSLGGMLLTKTETRTPGGLVSSAERTRTVKPSKTDAAGLRSFTDEFTINDAQMQQIFDAKTRKLTFVSAEKRKREVVFDEAGKILQVTQGKAVLQLKYDNQGRAVGVSQATRQLSVSYDPSGRINSTTDPAGRTMRFTYNTQGRPDRITASDGREVSFQYGVGGMMTAIQPPGRNAHLFKYSPSGRLLEYSPPEIGGASSSIRLEYDIAGNLQRLTTPDGQTLEYLHDDLERVVAMQTADAACIFEYEDETGRIKTAKSSDGVVQAFEHDGFLQTRCVISGPVNGDLRRVYDANFRVCQRSINGSEIDYQRDGDGLLTQADILQIERTPTGAVRTLQAGCLSVTYDYDDYGDLKRHRVSNSGDVIRDTVYRRDDLGRILEWTVTSKGKKAASRTFTYDAAGRVASESGGRGVTRFSYDSNGNRLTCDNGKSKIQGVVDGQDRLCQWGSTSYEYASNGSLKSKLDKEQKWAYRFDLLGQLRSVELPDHRKVAYLHDGLGRRVLKTIDGKTTQGLLYEGAFPIAQLGASGKVQSRFVYGTRVHVPDLMITKGQTFLIVTDHLGSPMLVIDCASGEIAQEIEYDVFGNVLSDTAPGLQPFGFAGGLYDADTGLTRFYSRDYEAATGRWTSRDAILFAGGDTNLYAYCGNDPVNDLDPFGFSCGCKNDPPAHEIGGPIDGLWWYIRGGGQPAKLSDEFLQTLAWSYGTWYGVDSNTGIAYLVPFTEEGSWASRTTTGRFRYTVDGNCIYITDHYAFPWNSNNFLLAPIFGWMGNPYDIHGCFDKKLILTPRAVPTPMPAPPPTLPTH